MTGGALADSPAKKKQRRLMSELNLPQMMDRGSFGPAAKLLNQKDRRSGERNSNTDTQSDGSTSPSTLEENKCDSGDDDLSQFSPCSVV